MGRVKTFVATGIAPNGRLYAGDLNSIQDFYLPISDFTSTVDVGTLRVGDPTLQLFKYGAGEFRMTGALRTDGILRGLGGLYGGAFTTAQRDAIPAGLRPYGLIILNTTDNQYQWNVGTDAAPSWTPLGGGVPAAHAASHSPGAGDALVFSAINLAGTRAAKPAASTANNGLLYYETDWLSLWRSNGSAWLRVANTRRFVAISDFPSLSPADGDEIALEISSGVVWDLRYNAGSVSAYKWEWQGGTSLLTDDAGVGVITSTSYISLGTAISLPRAGDYDIESTFRVHGIITAYSEYLMSYSIGGASALDSDAAGVGLITDLQEVGSGLRRRRKTGLTASTIQPKFKKSAGASNANAIDVSLKITPVRIT